MDQALAVIHGASAPRADREPHPAVRALLPQDPGEEVPGRAGQDIHEEVVRRRVEAARRLLRDTTLTVAAIASEHRLCQRAAISISAFRKALGTTPGGYRRSYRG